MPTPTKNPSPPTLNQTPIAPSRSLPLPPPPPSLLNAPSPAYISNLRSRHALYGTDDRVILDLGSRLWKAGFSSESCPRIVISLHDLCPSLVLHPSSSLHLLDQHALALALRRIFFDFLMVDPKTRKVLLVEPALLPEPLRSRIAIVLFDQLHVPSISFTPSSLLVLIASGTITGLVIDVAHLESTVLPVYLSRPLFPLVRATTRASARLNARLKALLLRFASYIPIPKFGQSSANLSSGSPPVRVTHVPPELLTTRVIEDIKTRLLFVAQHPLRPLPPQPPSDHHHLCHHHSPPPPPDSPSAIISPPIMDPKVYSEESDDVLLDTLERYYKHSTDPQTQHAIYRLPSSHPNQRGVLKIPNWIRERAAEILFARREAQEEEEEAPSVTETILASLSKLPVDLRKPLAANMVICGGGAMLPGFVGRLKRELADILADPPTRFRSLAPLASSVFILNDRQPSDESLSVPRTRPPAFQMHLLGWIGGSLAGAMRISGQEVIREHWDAVVESCLVSQEVEENRDDEDEEEEEWGRRLVGLRIASGILPDWTRLSAA